MKNNYEQVLCSFLKLIKHLTIRTEGSHAITVTKAKIEKPTKNIQAKVRFSVYYRINSHNPQII